MRLYTVILFLTCFFVGFASESSAQRVTLNAKKTAFSAVIVSLTKQSGYNILMKRELMLAQQPVTLHLADASLEEVLDQLLADKPFIYEIDNDLKLVVIKEAPTPSVISTESREIGKKSLILAYAEVRGRVVDSVGNPLQGASVRVINADGQRTVLQTKTDNDGYFSLGQVPEDAQLEITFVGYISKTVAAKGDVGTIALTTLPSELNEVEINAGYYTVKDRERTGSISRITAEEIARQPVSNPLQAMQGRMAGVQIQQLTGVPGGGFNIQIRGRNSLRNDGNAPLYIVDGVPFTGTSLTQSTTSGTIVQDVSPLNTINPYQIESIEVLKDADATAIYGSRGANGVVLITTKSGKNEGTRFSASFNTGIGKVASRMELLNTTQYLEMRREAHANNDAVPAGYTGRDLLQWDTTRYTDWQEALIGGTAGITNAQLSVTGVQGDTRFSAGGGYYRESTVFPGDFADKRISANVSIHHAAFGQRLQLALQANYLVGDNNLPRTDAMRNALTLPPNAPALFDEAGNLNWENSTWQNPLAQLRMDYSGASHNLTANATIRYEIIPGFHAKVSTGYNDIGLDEVSLMPISAVDPISANYTGTAIRGRNGEKTWIAEPQLEYQRQWGRGTFNALLGSTFQVGRREGQLLLATGYTNDALLHDITAASSIISMNYNYSEYRYNAVFARLNYSWNDRYIVNLTGRRDGSSRFGPDKRFANFGAVGAAWVFSNAAVFQRMPFISFGKLRASYGLVGSDQIGDYAYMDTYTATTPYQGSSGLIPTRLVNPNYAWETNRKLEGAMELGFLEDRIRLTAAYYRNRSSNQLVGYALPATTGFSTVQHNLPAVVQNTGWEFDAQSRNIQSGQWLWETGFNITFPDNVLVAYPNIEGSSYANTYEVGKSLFARKLRKFTGVDRETGLYTFADVDGNGTGGESPGDLVADKSLTPDFYGGLQNSVSYRSFRLDIFFQFAKQLGNNFIMSGFGTPGYLGNQPVEVLDRWQREGDQATYQRFTHASGPAGTAQSHFAASDARMSDASYIRLRNVSLSWELPRAWVSRINMDALRLSFAGQNLWTITRFRGMDPENQSLQALPPLRVLTVGLQANF